MRILLLGASGQIGWHLRQTLMPIGVVTAFERKDANLEELQSLEQTLQTGAPDVIVNAAAYTDVDGAERERQAAYRINAEAPGIMAHVAERLGALLIHYSTDYVFDGEKAGAYREDDTISPLNVYGETKAQGEANVRATGCRHIILRTSWVYSLHGRNFARTIIRLAQERDELQVVADQAGAPTSAESIAYLTAQMLDRVQRKAGLDSDLLGTFHLTSRGATTWHGFALRLLEACAEHGFELRASPASVHAVASKEYLTAARRPANSVLDCAKLCDSYALKLPRWESDADRFVSQLCAKGKA